MIENASNPMLSFLDPIDETIEVVDRSTLENFSNCPAQAVNILRGRVNTSSNIGNVGQEVHDAFGAATACWVQSNGSAEPAELAQEMESRLRASRPDVQPDALAAAKYSCWSWAKWLNGIHPDNILHYDGGQGERSGQLGHDFADLRLRVTAEVDFLATSRSPEVLDEIDYKSGWKNYGIDEVAERFQFQMHGFLILENYPDIKAVSLRVWQPRRGGAGYPVLFERRHLGEWEARIRATCQQYLEHRNDEPSEAPIWPSAEKCPICPAAAICPASGLPVQAMKENPAAYVREMYALETRLKEMKDIAWLHVKESGVDIDAGEGVFFGRGKPKKETKPPNPLYAIKKADPDSSTTET